METKFNWLPAVSHCFFYENIVMFSCIHLPPFYFTAITVALALPVDTLISHIWTSDKNSSCLAYFSKCISVVDGRISATPCRVSPVSTMGYFFVSTVAVLSPCYDRCCLTWRYELEAQCDNVLTSTASRSPTRSETCKHSSLKCKTA